MEGARLRLERRSRRAANAARGLLVRGRSMTEAKPCSKEAKAVRRADSVQRTKARKFNWPMAKYEAKHNALLAEIAMSAMFGPLRAEILGSDEETS
jgi:hypothetical protein